MPRMHESTPQCLRRPGRQGVRAVVAALLLPAVAAAAEPALPASGVGPWLFASVALLLVAAGSFAAGAARRHHRQEPQGPQGASPTPPAASAQSAAATDAPPLPARVRKARANRSLPIRHHNCGRTLRPLSRCQQSCPDSQAGRTHRQFLIAPRVMFHRRAVTPGRSRASQPSNNLS